jgi:UPF0716 protein FxsA
VLARLIALFVAVPVAELALLVWLGRRVGLVPTVALILVTGVLGAALARWQGLATLDRFRVAMATGRPPHREVVDGVLILVAGAVLLTPGLLTDAAGFLLLVPAVRRRVRDRLVATVRRRLLAARGGDPAWAAQETVEAEFRVLGADGEGRPRGGDPTPPD